MLWLVRGGGGGLGIGWASVQFRAVPGLVWGPSRLEIWMVGTLATSN